MSAIWHHMGVIGRFGVLFCEGGLVYWFYGAQKEKTVARNGCG